jgi:hypothetical protein
MPSDVTIVIAETARMPTIRDGLHLAGRGRYFTDSNLAAALESIRAHRPQLIAVDALFAQTPQGLAFIDRVEKMAIVKSDIRLIAHVGSSWTMTPRTSSVAIVDAPLVGLNTRRVPRFLVRDPLKAVVESSNASLVDLSVLGAQVVSQPALRPNQKIKVALPDTEDTLRVMAQVAWSIFEKPKTATEAYYRAGIEFTDAAQQALEDFCRRHCGDKPIPYRGR